MAGSAGPVVPGDTLVLAYAGHGGQEPERVLGSERDGQDKVLLLGGFRSAGAGTRERICDDELNQWFSDAGGQGLPVVFVADSCHSGTLTRSIDARAPSQAIRSSPYTITDDMLFLGACHYHTVDAEIIVQFRGAFRPFSSVGVRQCLA